MLETGIACESVQRSRNAERLAQPSRIVALVERYFDWRERARQRRHLSALSRHMLKDIGLTSVEVEAELGKRFW